MKQEKSNVLAFHGGKASPQNADEQITVKTGVPPIKTRFLSAWRAGAWQAQGNPPATPPAAPVQGAASTAPATKTQKHGGGGNDGGGSNNVPPTQPGKPAPSVGEILMRNAVIVGILGAVGLMFSAYLDDKKHARETALQTEAIRNNVTTLPAVPNSSTATRSSMTYAQASAMPATSVQATSSNSFPDCLVVGKVGFGESCTLKEPRTDVNVDYPTTWTGSSSCVEQKTFEVTDDATQSVVRPMMNNHGNQSLRSCGQYSYSVSKGTLYFVKR